MTLFQEKVWSACKLIPKGRISTYALIAKKTGNKNSSRAVGNALNKNPFAPVVPCHRVVKSDSSLGGFASSSKNKKLLLEREGIKVKSFKVVDFEKVLFKF
ncbi:MAG: MGMT family protein [archaeon]